MPNTTKTPAACQGDEGQATNGASRSQQFQPTSKEQNMNHGTNPAFPFVEGQKVSITGSVYAGCLGTVTSVDEDGPWRVHVKIDGTSFPPVYFAPEELAPVRTDDSVPATDEEVVEFLTGTSVGETTTEVDLHTCPEPGCDFAIRSSDSEGTAPVADVLKDIADHELTHAPWGHINALDLWATLREVPAVYDAISSVFQAITPADVARVLRAAADVLEPETQRANGGDQ